MISIRSFLDGKNENLHVGYWKKKLVTNIIRVQSEVHKETEIISNTNTTHQTSKKPPIFIRMKLMVKYQAHTKNKKNRDFHSI